jgi:hypothetical protein
MPAFYHADALARQGSDLSGNVRPGSNQNAARNANDALIGAAACCHWQFGTGFIRHVDTDDGKIAIFEFPNVRTVFKRWGFLSIFVWIRAESAEEVHGGGGVVCETEYLLSFWRQVDLLAKCERE